MQNLQTFAIGLSSLSGTIPSSMFNCSALKIVDVSLNKLQGEFPPDINLRLPRLVFLNLNSNHFSGAFPSSILNLTNFEFIGLDNNKFTGRVPHDFGHLHRLWWLNLIGNNFKGDINFVGTLVNCTQLEVLQLAGNDFQGTLPESIGNLSTSLRSFILAATGIRGEIPKGITNLISLESINLARNALTGSIPSDFGKLVNLQLFAIEYNLLTASIPNSFGNLSRLSNVYLNDNQFQGSVPPSLGHCQGLLDLNLSSNQLDGMLVDKLFNGSAKFISVDLSNNLLEGSIPVEINKQQNLVEFLVSRNKLSGVIPYGLSDCLALHTLDIHGNSFHGDIPTSFSSLDSLQIVDFSLNNLSGTIPNYLSKFPLQLLNLSYNNFEGQVPTTGVFANITAVALDGNIQLCGGIPKLHLPRCMRRKEPKKRRELSLALKLTVTILCTLIGVILISTWLYLTYRRKKKVPISSGSTRESFPKVSYDTLLKATNGFSSENLVGAGSFGSVFRGNLERKPVAIKVLKLQTRGASKSFMVECKALQNVRHRNLVGIITVCSSNDFHRNEFKALVYEFMPNGNLDSWLHGDRAESLTLLQRVGIALDVAHALSYLHNDCEIPIVHCHLKPSNILLDNDMIAHVGDFGLAKFLGQPQHPNQRSSIGILGTVGYVPPEYGLGSQSSPDGDLYSFGILVLELMTGKRPTDNMFNEGHNLQKYVEEALPDNVLLIIDPALEDNEINKEVDDIRTIQAIAQRRVDSMVSMISVGIACSKHLAQDRMKISDAISKLQVAKDEFINARQRRQFPKGT